MHMFLIQHSSEYSEDNDDSDNNDDSEYGEDSDDNDDSEDSEHGEESDDSEDSSSQQAQPGSLLAATCSQSTASVGSGGDDVANESSESDDLQPPEPKRYRKGT